MLFYLLLFVGSSAFAQAFENVVKENLTLRTSSGIDLSPLWLPRSYKMTCCLGGQPIPENSQLVRNWTQEYSVQEQDGERATGSAEDSLENCHVFQGSYLLSASALFSFNGLNGVGVICKCPVVSGRHHLDKNCRRLAPCQNNGYRAFSMNLRCVCVEPYFGEYCEKFCDQGQRMKGADGRDYCGCVPFYQGEECRDMVCLNGGTEIKQRCLCPPNFLGYHCEIDTNRTSGASRFQRYGDQGADLFTRDVSGTIFSLIMIIVLIVSMYLLMKHRMQVQNRFATMRRDDLSRNHGMPPRRGDMVSPEDARILPFRAAPVLDVGPPPYVPHQPRGRVRRHELLPPLPSYEDATKLPPLTRPPPLEESSESVGHDSLEGDCVESPRGTPPHDGQPSTSASECAVVVAQAPIFVVDRTKIERASSTRKSI